MKIHPVAAEFHADGRTGMPKLFAVLRTYPKIRTNIILLCTSYAWALLAVLASGIPTVTLYSHTLTFFPARATCPTYLILVMFVESRNREVPVMSLFLPSCYFYCLGPGIQLSILFSHTLTVRFMMYDIYLTAIGLTPGGSSTVHIYTQTVHLVTHPVRTTESYNFCYI
jgi:hypothetical protein